VPLQIFRDDDDDDDDDEDKHRYRLHLKVTRNARSPLMKLPIKTSKKNG